MTVLSAANSASIRVIGTNLAALFSSTDQVAVEFRDLINDVAQDIVDAHDWRDLTKIATFTGDGVTAAFNPPADFGRMAQGSYIDDPDVWLWGYCAIPSMNEWMRRTGRAWISPGGWIRFGGQFHFHPAPSGDAAFPYVSSQWVRSEGGAPQAAFLTDSDTFVLDERLLTLGLVWRWRAQKGLDYSEDMATYELGLSQAMTWDAGARVIRKPTRRNAFGAWPAWPWELG